MEGRFQIQVIVCLILMPGFIFLPYFLNDSPIKKTAYSIRANVLEEVPLRSSKSKVFEYIRGKKWRNWSLGKEALDSDPSNTADILVFTKDGILGSNFYYNFKKENNFIKVDLGSYLDFQKSWKFIARVKVSLYFLFLNEELVQVRAIKIFV